MARVYVSSIIPASAATVWRVIRDFNALPRWTPFVARSEIEGGLPADQIGCVRRFVQKDGGVIRERLLALSDVDMACTYSILESPMGVEDYQAVLSLQPVTDGDVTFACWTAEFTATKEREAELTAFIGTSVFLAAFRHLQGVVK